MANHYLILGLGNPDPQYEKTRHNVGFMFVDRVRRSLSEGGLPEFQHDSKLKALVAKGKLEKTPIILAKPQTYVNKSGEAAKKLVKNWKLKIENLIVVHDDLDIPFGNVKLSFEKDSGGHKGVESIMRHLKTKKFWRLRIGTQSRSLISAKRKNPRKKEDAVVNFVLGSFTPTEKAELNKMFKTGMEKLLTAISR